MRWQGGRQSENIDDRRGVRGPVMVGGGIMTLVIVGIVLLLGGDPRALLQQLPQQGGQGQVQPGDPGAEPASDEQKQFVAAVLAQTEDVWDEQFRQMGKQYRKPVLVLFRDETRSACGFADKAVGPFYCPADNQVYLDLSFFQELEERFKATGDFARAYVVAHEIGHHVQHLLGTSDRVRSMQQGASESQANDLSVRLELQADFLAGVWAHHANREYQILEHGDVEEALNAAEAIGDDRLQKRTRGYAVPDSFTHGTSEQRARWFTKGLKTGDIDQGDTFAAGRL